MIRQLILLLPKATRGVAGVVCCGGIWLNRSLKFEDLIHFSTQVCPTLLDRLAREGGDFYEPSAVYLREFPIPTPSADMRASLEQVVEQILTLKKSNADTAAQEAEANRLVYALYQLSEEEIALVEGK